MAQRRTTTPIGALDVAPQRRRDPRHPVPTAVHHRRRPPAARRCLAQHHAARRGTPSRPRARLAADRSRYSPASTPCRRCSPTRSAATTDTLAVDPEVTSIALKAVRDAIAAAYCPPDPHAGRARRADEGMAQRLSDRPRRRPGPRAVGPADVMSLLVAMPRLAARCHDADAAAEYDVDPAAAESVDEDIRCAARDEAWHAAVLTSRRRVWQLIRRSGAEGLDSVLQRPASERDATRTRPGSSRCASTPPAGCWSPGTLDDDIVEVLIDAGAVHRCRSSGPPSVA